ncbi:amino acid permease [Coprinopsis cinerea okayama7|uniref:Amino acid permease n=1 Tax=Coprinopsis cinerea (strain Okayama-7 / 130 / ATCC MYA-4618 / FGSC 9003) TaxID=240176 RepID=A8N6C7_COPC7|nr:amino acid permease [Coprinopsis cinerea okayama7\|eukprot:XP_001830396.2 amino acid permease [Coprinopsis cinerea okayama7\
MTSPLRRSAAESPSRSSIQPNYGASSSRHDEETARGRSKPSGLQRELSARQVQMIAIAGTIGTGLFLGTGKSLAQGGPASMLICYSIIGFIVYVTLLLLGEMATQYPVAGSFNAYTTRFFSPAYGFALGWNYWFNDAVSVASDLTAAQLVIQFWATSNAWVVSVVFWVFLVGVNAIHVRAYGELEYWLSSLKVITVILFIIVGTLVNMGFNTESRVIGFENWRIPGAPFVGGFGGFAHVFVTASYAFGGTESLGITAGETRNPTKNMPRVVKLVFWRILTFYLLTILLIGLNGESCVEWAQVLNIVGVSNQIAWLSIGLSSWRFRKAWLKQGRAPEQLKFRASWTWPWGPPFVVVGVTVLIIVQGWSSFVPKFSPVDFISFYIEVPIMLLMTVAYLIRSRSFSPSLGVAGEQESEPLLSRPCERAVQRDGFADLVDVSTVDLYADEHTEEEEDESTEDKASGVLQRIYYWLV